MRCIACFEAEVAVRAPLPAGTEPTAVCRRHIGVWRKSELGAQPSYKDFSLLIGGADDYEWVPISSLERVHTRYTKHGQILLTLSSKSTVTVKCERGSEEANRFLIVLKCLKKHNPSEALELKRCNFMCDECNAGSSEHLAGKENGGAEHDNATTPKSEYSRPGPAYSNSARENKRKHSGGAGETGMTPQNKQARTDGADTAYMPAAANGSSSPEGAEPMEAEPTQEANGGGVHDAASAAAADVAPADGVTAAAKSTSQENERMTPRKRRESGELRTQRNQIKAQRNQLDEEKQELERERQDIQRRRQAIEHERDALNKAYKAKEEDKARLEKLKAQVDKLTKEYETSVKNKDEKAEEMNAAAARMRAAQQRYSGHQAQQEPQGQQRAQQEEQQQQQSGFTQQQKSGTNSAGAGTGVGGSAQAGTARGTGTGNAADREKEERERARKVQEEAARRQQQEARKRAEEEARRKRREEEERKRNEERERKQQEEDRKQRERTSESKKQKEQRLLQQSKPRAQMIEQRFDMLAKQWERLRKSNSQTLGVSSFPWPDTSSNAALGERVAFITAVDDQTAIKSKVNKALMRWHPDKFSQTFGALLKPGEQEAVFDKVKAAAQLANELRELYL